MDLSNFDEGFTTEPLKSSLSSQLLLPSCDEKEFIGFSYSQDSDVC